MKLPGGAAGRFFRGLPRLFLAGGEELEESPESHSDPKPGLTSPVEMKENGQEN